MVIDQKSVGEMYNVILGTPTRYEIKKKKRSIQALREA